MKARSTQFVFCLVATTLVCSCTHGHLYQVPGDRNYPERNPSPSHQVRFELILPPGLQATKTIVTYATEIAHGCWTGPSWAEGGAPAGRAPLQVTVSVAIEQNGDRASGEFALDYFKPGRCAWHFSAVGAAIERSGVPPRGVTFGRRAADEPESTYANRDATPVFAHARARSGQFICIRPQHNKGEQLVDETTREIEVHVIEDPIPVNGCSA
jgi:hypothetical protein